MDSASVVNPLGLALPCKIVGLGFLKFERVGYNVFFSLMLIGMTLFGLLVWVSLV